MEWGVRFDRAPDGEPALALEAAHSCRRVLHAGDATGREIGRALWDRTVGLPSVQTVKHALVTDLIVTDGLVRGLRYFDAAGRLCEVYGSAVLLATGGAGQIFRETTNPAVATGDGIALAFAAGAQVADLEFVQFHPTALDLAGAPRFLLSEALRGEGARLVNGQGEPFMQRYHADGDLAPRDVVARSIVREASSTGAPVALTMAHLDAAAVRSRFPSITKTCRQMGLDLATDRIPVGPAAHYLMGGIATDGWGRTSLEGLFAAGETACTGVHGANRLASNSLLEGLVFGARAAAAMQGRDAGSSIVKSADWRMSASSGLATPEPDPNRIGGDVVPAADLAAHTASVRDVMWRSVGLFRNRRRLETAVAMLQTVYQREHARIRFESAPTADSWRRVNLVTVALLVARAALRREESRGGHFREDFPERDDRHWRFHAMEVRTKETDGLRETNSKIDPLVC
jgi:L-aspartate oxidase